MFSWPAVLFRHRLTDYVVGIVQSVYVITNLGQ